MTAENTAEGFEPDRIATIVSELLAPEAVWKSDDGQIATRAEFDEAIMLAADRLRHLRGYVEQKLDNAFAEPLMSVLESTPRRTTITIVVE